MQIHQLKKTYKTKKKKRVGRGGKKGNYSGRGMKGQKSRAGHKIKPQIRETILKFPKQRGVKFQPLKEKPLVVLLSDIVRKFPQSCVITPKKLEKAGLISQPKSKKYPVKILGQMDLKYAYTIRGCLVSNTARESILKAQGKIEEVKENKK